MPKSFRILSICGWEAKFDYSFPVELIYRLIITGLQYSALSLVVKLGVPFVMVTAQNDTLMLP